MYIRFLTTLFATLLSSWALATISNLRLVVRDNPSYNVTIGFQQSGGGEALIYWGDTDYGDDYERYPNQSPANASVRTVLGWQRYLDLQNLRSNTYYYFVLVDDDGPSQRYYFQTCPESAENPITMVYGANLADNQASRQEAFTMISKLRPHLVVLGGDYTVLNIDFQWNNLFTDWQLSTTSDGRVFPILPIIGDRENLGNSLSTYFRARHADGFYHIPFGKSLLGFYALNSNFSGNQNQRDWLSQQLSLTAAQYHWKFAAYHQAMRSHQSSQSNNEDAYVNWAYLFFQYSLDLVFEGSAQVHKQSKPIIPISTPGTVDGFKEDEKRGAIYLGDGTMGSTAVSPDNTWSWTAHAAAEQQLQWIYLDKDSCGIRSVDYRNADEVENRENWESPYFKPEFLRLNAVNGQETTYITRVKNGAAFVEISNPVNSPVIEQQFLDVSWNAGVEGGGQITQVKVFVDNTLISTLSGNPGHLTVNGLSPGMHSVQVIVNDDQGRQAVSLAETVFVKEKQTSTAAANGNMDAEEQVNIGLVTLDDPVLHLGSKPGTLGASPSAVGLIFQGLKLGPQAVITEAYIQFTSYEPSANASSQLLIYPYADVNPAAFNTQLGNVSSRNKSNDFIIWDVPVWLAANLADTDMRSPDLSAILQKRLNANGKIDNVGFVITGNGSRNVYSQEGDLRKSPRLIIKYTEPSTGISEQVQPEITIGPNPASDFLQLHNGHNQGVQLYIRDAEGKLVLELRLPSRSEQKISLENLAPGAYQIMYSDGKNKGFQKFIKS